MPRRNPLSRQRTKRYYVYIMSSKGRVLYVGMTGFLVPRVLQHKSGETEGFTRRYHITRLVYYEVFRYVNNAIARETEIKKWRREKKVALIESVNPLWNDLAADWGQPIQLGKADSSRDKAALRNDKGLGL
jgi:putative endonuclease